MPPGIGYPAGVGRIGQDALANSGLFEALGGTAPPTTTRDKVKKFTGDLLFTLGQSLTAAASAPGQRGTLAGIGAAFQAPGQLAEIERQREEEAKENFIQEMILRSQMETERSNRALNDARIRDLDRPEIADPVEGDIVEFDDGVWFVDPVSGERVRRLGGAPVDLTEQQKNFNDFFDGWFAANPGIPDTPENRSRLRNPVFREFTEVQPLPEDVQNQRVETALASAGVTPDSISGYVANVLAQDNFDDVPSNLIGTVASEIIRRGAELPTPDTGPSEYSMERAARTISIIDSLVPQVSGWTVGVGGTLASAIPASAAADFVAELDTLKSNIAFNELTAMREASKTGGALGQVSERELNLLESALGALSIRQSPTSFRNQLQRIKESVLRWQAAAMGSEFIKEDRPVDQLTDDELYDRLIGR